MGAMGLHTDSNTEKRVLEKLDSGASKSWWVVRVPIKIDFVRSSLTECTRYTSGYVLLNKT